MKLLSMLSDVIFQVIIFSLLPFLWWFFTARRKESFFAWIGLKAVKGSWPKIIGGILFFFLLCLISQLWWIPHLLPAGTGIRPPARSHVFSGDHTAEGADDYTDYRLQRLAPRMDDGKNGGRLHPSRLDGPRGRESATLHGGGIRITMTDKTAK